MQETSFIELVNKEILLILRLSIGQTEKIVNCQRIGDRKTQSVFIRGGLSCGHWLGSYPSIENVQEFIAAILSMSYSWSFFEVMNLFIVK